MKGGLNDYGIYVIQPFDYSDPKIKCRWLGHFRFKCGHCKQGYFNVHTESNHDSECPGCKYRVVVRFEN